MTPLPLGGARARRTKVTQEILDTFEAHINADCSTTLQDLVFKSFGVRLSLSTISARLCGMLYTVKEVRVEPTTYNSDMIMYCDETNFNVHCKRGERAMLRLPSTKAPNLQIQCTVASSVGVVHSVITQGSIKIEANAAFIEQVYQKAKASAAYAAEYSGKKIVIVFDNAPAHRRSELLVPDADDIVLLRLAP
ncbi:TPA: hypothetical protein N0F65_010271 [Lagenidium giganteum]|uniref:Tc1-like transposase DDE domain-containing protein n=1 Tax=Lagenidium giganteum TaxID=4803 RepID=A0AAV2YQU8_9STRA|nr:TPA: hypothetical protein N0F65_010271 [Lagenidium giganteum]